MTDLNKLLDEYEEVAEANMPYYSITNKVYHLGYLTLLEMTYDFTYETNLRISKLKDRIIETMCEINKREEKKFEEQNKTLIEEA